jgi:23S rRNA (pseudouridine1915-N3)-methyltransferase
MVIGKTVPSFMAEGVSEYMNRIGRYCSFEYEVLADAKRPSVLSPERLSELEAEVFLKRIKANDFVILLDEKGLLQSSEEMALQMKQWMNSGIVNPTFIIGGAYGFGKSLRERSNTTWSMSPMTFSHQLARLVFGEQLYRAFTIIKGEPYHHK